MTDYFAFMADDETAGDDDLIKNNAYNDETAGGLSQLKDQTLISCPVSADDEKGSLNEVLPISETDWSFHVDAFFLSGTDIRKYALDHHLNYNSFKFRIYRDPRYVRKGRVHTSVKKQEDFQLIEAEILDERKRTAVTLNGFELSFKEEESLRTFLRQLKSL